MQSSCQAIFAKSLNVLGHPYDIDFPSFSWNSTPDDQFGKLIESPITISSRSTIPIIRKTISLVWPCCRTDAVRSAFWENGHANLVPYFHMKLRLFAQPIRRNGQLQSADRSRCRASRKSHQNCWWSFFIHWICRPGFQSFLHRLLQRSGLSSILLPRAFSNFI